MSYKVYRNKNPLLDKEYTKRCVDTQARLAYNAGANDGFNFVFWPALFVFTLVGIWCWFSI